MDNFRGTCFLGCFCLCSPTSIFSSAHSGILRLAESGWSRSCWLKRATGCGDSASDLWALLLAIKSGAHSGGGVCKNLSVCNLSRHHSGANLFSTDWPVSWISNVAQTKRMPQLSLQAGIPYPAWGLFCSTTAAEWKRGINPNVIKFVLVVWWMAVKVYAYDEDFWNGP